MSEPADQLADTGAPTGLIILNRGDPAFSRSPISSRESMLVEAEGHFVFVIAYLLFADAIVLPSRFMLDGDAMAQTSYWLAPLLQEGIVIPERRGGVASFLDAARARRLDERAFRRAEFLDSHTSTSRSFQFARLGETYVELLRRDLDPDGAFRRTVLGARRGKLAGGFDIARDAYASMVDVTPEAFARAVGGPLPQLTRRALQWAMARYYTTPLFFDDSNTRELPSEAAELLAKGGVLDLGAPRFDGAAPVAEAITRISARIPAMDVRRHSEAYCTALLEVRARVPEARKAFSTIRDRSALLDASASLSADFQSELQRQLKVRTKPGYAYALGTSLLGGAAGFGIAGVAGTDFAMQLVAGLGSSVGSGIGTQALANRLEDRRKRTRAPWLLAIDEFDAALPSDS